MSTQQSWWNDLFRFCFKLIAFYGLFFGWICFTWSKILFLAAKDSIRRITIWGTRCTGDWHTPLSTRSAFQKYTAARHDPMSISRPRLWLRGGMHVHFASRMPTYYSIYWIEKREYVMASVIKKYQWIFDTNRIDVI